MKKNKSFFIKTITFIMMLFSLIAISSCSDDDDDDNNKSDDNNPSSTQPDIPAYITGDETIFMYLPWSGSSIYTYLVRNISAFETAIEQMGGMKTKHFIVFVAPNATSARLINIVYDGTACKRDTIKTYTFETPTYTTQEGISSIINDVKEICPANEYSMLIGCHGKGWIPVSNSSQEAYKKAAALDDGRQKTRYFGHSSDSKYQTNITTLAQAIISSAIKMQYILFDDCYMSNIETAYDLKDATNYLIASTSEIMIDGMPYSTMGSYLINHDYEGACAAFYNFYINFSTPCGTIAVTACDQAEAMASIMKRINTLYPDGLSSISDLQILDGYTPTIFFDFGDYVLNLCQDNSLFIEFLDELDLLVPYKANTPTFYSEYTGRQTQINTFSGLTISDPSTDSSIKTYRTQTAWYSSTH